MSLSNTRVASITYTVSTSQHDNASTFTNTNITPKPTDNSTNYEDPSDVRNSSTPVVSLLSLDQQQEKDFISLQGGRRRKSANPPQSYAPPISPKVYSSNGYINPYAPISYQTAPSQPFNTYNTNVSHNRTLYNSGYQRRVNGFDNRYNNGKNRKRNYDSNRTSYNNDHSSRSSLRTDSNSSASCVDENKNEDKTHIRTAVNTPPPTSCSPLANSFKLFPMSNYHNANNSRNSNYSKYNYNRSHYYNNNNYYYEKFKGSNDSSNNGKNSGTNNSSDNGANNNNFSSYSQPNSTPQVHVATSQGLVPSASSGFNSAPPNARRNRRSIRRSGTGGGVNEIGAGDAPLPSEVGSEVCKKLETLKL